MFRLFLGAYAALAIVASLSFAINHSDANSLVSASTCPCGQCEAGCGCCLDQDNCACETCACEQCGAATQFVMTTSALPTCCSSGGSCPMSNELASKAAAALASTTSGLASTSTAELGCELGCECGVCEAGCNCCVSDDCTCEGCECECEACAS